MSLRGTALTTMVILVATVLSGGSLKTTTKGLACALLQPTSSLSNAAASVFREGYSASTGIPIVATTRTATALRATNNGDTNKKLGRKQGVYVRPSGAIERGSGFFVPGLEGPKVRLVIGFVLLAATGVNHFVLGVSSSGSSSEDPLSFSEITAVVYSILLLFQSAIEYVKEALPAASGDASSTPARESSSATADAAADDTEVLEQKWSTVTDIESGYRSRVQWAAASYLSMTPTTQMMLLDDSGEGKTGTVRYRLGGTENAATGETETGATAALDELRQSKGGRISLPLTHPAVTALLESSSIDESGGGDRPRTVVLQRITQDSCWMVISDQLLAGYTQGDLRWLGRLAGYVATTE